MRTLRYLKNNTLVLNDEKCVGCGICIEVCPHGVFALDGKKAGVVNKNNCMECGACQTNCPAKAVSVDAGVGCAAAVIAGALAGTEPICGCSGDGSENSSGCC